ncbi:hypothetical protein RGUI_4118 [Rhodovulum sp. P5]|uniref:hypothetical protein n=1 Tax=Rhodovulum phage vB_RhkS_P1 TaxID=1873452 RepID=UPI00080AAEF1|nr:hypothetical protein [Rhodovulum sp. P5]YP_009285941.1 hypothetical protein BI026_gp56 [Rhodovulum phage vB_RhkS_P1]ANT39927.1 hypothetical protein Rhks_56 [Rhodovulum phage vB_RhkS_P1]ARE38995.1 hypothetical protein RGUI_0854 [Rhodovulum sp. P5]ARE42259.1 hypothetical protein RGUI_4118 [Rhodovulum sp. P5]
MTQTSSAAADTTLSDLMTTLGDTIAAGVASRIEAALAEQTSQIASALADLKTATIDRRGPPWTDWHIMTADDPVMPDWRPSAILAAGVNTSLTLVGDSGEELDITLSPGIIFGMSPVDIQGVKPGTRVVLFRSEA